MVTVRFGQSEYKDEYCDLVIKMFSDGKALEDFCIEVGVGRKTVYSWIDRYPASFGEAYTLAREYGKAYRNRFIHENSFTSNSPEAENYDIKTYEKVSSRRFKDMELEAPNLNLCDKKMDLMEMIAKVIELTANGNLEPAQGRVLSDMITSVLKIKEQDIVIKKLDEIEKIMELGQQKSTYIVSPECIAESADDYKTE